MQIPASFKLSGRNCVIWRVSASLGNEKSKEGNPRNKINRETKKKRI